MSPAEGRLGAAWCPLSPLQRAVVLQLEPKGQPGVLVPVALPVPVLGACCCSACCLSNVSCSVSSPAVTVVNEDVQPRQYLMCGQTAQVKLKNVVPHDIGDPGKGSGWACWGAKGVQGCSHNFLRVVNSQAVGKRCGAWNTLFVFWE